MKTHSGSAYIEYMCHSEGAKRPKNPAAGGRVAAKRRIETKRRRPFACSFAVFRTRLRVTH